MKTVVVAGSPRKGKNSDSLAEIYARRKGAEAIFLRDYKIGNCSACDYCKSVEKGKCAKRDDMDNLYQRVIEADEIAIFSPIYWWQVTAICKAFIDRLYAIEHDAWKGKRLTVVLNGEASDDDKEYSILKDAFKEMADYLSMEFSYLGICTEENNKECLEKAEKSLLAL